MARVSSSTFVARKRELEAMTAAVIGSSSGAPLLTLVIGEAGVGKTRLVREVGAAAESAGAQVITGGCVPLGSGTVPFAPIREAMRDLATRRTERELEDLLGTARDELVSLVPSLGAAAAHSSQDAPQQGRMYELILGLFERMAAEGPTVIVLEDLHWADRSTIGLLSFLIRNVRAPGLRLIGTLRSDEVDRRDPLYAFLAETRRSERVTRVELRRFDRAETAELLRGILGTEPPAALADSVHRRSGGNAFFAEELVAASAEAGDVPDTLREVLLVRVGHLSDPTQRLLRIVAAAGRSVSAARLADVAGLPPDRVAATVQEAVAQQVLLVETGDEGEDRYLFRHALVQEAIEQELLPGERRRLHAAFATSLTDHPPASDAGAEAELAYHWFAAGDLPRAFAASLRAAESAEQGYAFAEAHAAYERALDLWDQVPAELRSGTDRIGILQRAAAAAAATQQFPEAVRLIQSAIEAVDGDPVRAGVLHERLGRYSLLAADTPQADAAYREAVRLVPSHPPTAERGRVVAGLAHYLMGAHNDEAIALCGEAIEVARTLGANEIEANALITRAGCRVGTGDLDGALEDATRGYELAVLIPGSVEAARAQKYLSEIHSVSGNDELAIDAATRGFDEAERLGLARSEGFAVLSSLASHLLGAGRWDEADVVMRRMERLGVSGWNALPFHDIHAHLDLARGHVDAAARHVAAAERLEEGDVEGEYEVNLINLRAQLAMAQGRAGAVARIVDDGLASLGDRDQWPGPMMWTFYQAVRADAEVAAQARRRRRAAEERQAIDAAERHAAQVRSVVEAIPPAHWETRDAEAMTALANAELGRARGIDDPLAWATSADAWAAARRLPQVEAYARWRAGAAYLTKPGADGRAAARAQLVRAREIAVALKAAPLREDVERVAARAHLPLTDAAATSTPSPGPGDLTVRELEVLELVAAGQSNRQIGESLFITEKTAGVHVSNVLGKLGVSRRTEAVAVARERGLL